MSAHPARWLLACLLAACAPAAGPAATGGAPPSGPPGGPSPGGAQGSLVIPADEPSWARLHGLLDHPAGYGEASWDDVRMRVLGHVATIGRDRARARAQQGDLAGCAAAYRDTAARLEAIPAASKTGVPIRAALLAAATRDAAFCDALARGEAPTDPGTGIASLRARWHALALRAGRGEDVHADAVTLAAAARAVVPPSLDLDGFADFEARHRLRVLLVEAYVDAIDPLRPAEPWGYWEPAEVTRVAEAIARASDALAPGVAAAPEALVPPTVRVPFTAEGLGALPTGDSLVDVVGFPGPRAIGSLAVLSLEDPTHRAWLDTSAARLEALPDAEARALLEELVAKLDAEPYGSRYYNVKQARNAGVRALASRGAYREARTLLASSWPLHAQDWACPDRAAILRAIEGRLLLVERDPGADAALDAALVEADRFLEHVAARDATGPRFPGPGAGPPGGPPPRR